jgi:hypothetical protein
MRLPFFFFTETPIPLVILDAPLTSSPFALFEQRLVLLCGSNIWKPSLVAIVDF